MHITSVCWLIAMFVFVSAEAATVSLVAIWFVGGALAGLIASMLGASVIAQIVIFTLVSAVLLALFRPILRKYIAVRKTSTNADRLVGQTAVVTQAIGGGIETGEVRLSGVLWTAIADGPVKAGEQVKILRVDGAKLHVAPACAPVGASQNGKQ